MNGSVLCPSSLRFTIVLGLLAAVPSLSIDITAPTLLTVQQQLSAPAGTVGLTITLFMLGFAAGQFGSGPLSDRYGRRPILLVGLTVYTLAAATCALSASISQLLASRLLQGVAAGSCTVLAFAMIRDLFEGEAARRKRSYVTVVFGIAPMLAPSLGAWILDHSGWRSVYLVLAAGGVALLTTSLLCIAESRRPLDLNAMSLPRAYKEVLSSRNFRQLSLLNAFSFGGMFGYISGSPLVLMGSYHLSAEAYGAVFASTAAALTFGAWLSGRSIFVVMSPDTILRAGIIGGVLSAAVLLLTMCFGQPSLVVLVPLLLINMAARGLVSPNAQHLALEPMADQAGTAAAAIGVMQILMGALASLVVSVLVPVMGPLGMGVVMAALAMCSGLLYWSMPGATPVLPVGPGRVAPVENPPETHIQRASSSIAVSEGAV